MELLSYLGEGNVANFLLLLLRFSGVVAFFPFFDSRLIPLSVKSALVLFLTILFFPLLPPFRSDLGLVEFALVGLSEILFGFMAAFFLQIAFAALSYAGEVLGFSVGMSVASAYDPVSGTQNLVIAQALSLVGMLVFLALDYHHIVFVLIANSLESTPLGGFVFTQDMASFFVRAMANLFVVGFSIAFPVASIILLSEIIFGMITRTHPQFNLLVLGLPIKLIIAFVVLIIAAPAMIFHFKEEILSAFRILAEMM